MGDRSSEIGVRKLEIGTLALGGFGGKQVFDLATHHGADDFGLVGRGRRPRPDRGAIAQDGKAVGQREDFIEPVRDVDTAQPSRAEIAQDPEKCLHLVFGKRRGGFVEDEDAGVLRQSLDDFDELLFTDTEPAHRRGRIDGDAESREQRAGVMVQFRPVDEGAAPRRRTEEYVFRDRHFLDQRKFLVNDGQTGAPGLGDPVKARDLPVDEQFSLVRAVRVQTAQELDQRRLARAVFAAQRVDFARKQVERHVLERRDAGEGFRDVACGEHGN